MKKHLLLALCALLPALHAAGSRKLTGTSIGSSKGYDFATGSVSSTANLRGKALDGDLDTYFASSHQSSGWVGLDLGRAYVIDKVGWASASVSGGPARTLLGLFEGANSPDFSDALPLHMVDEALPAGKMNYANVDVTRAFRYVRYKGGPQSRCNIAEVEFYGTYKAGSDARLCQLTNLPTVVIHTSTGQEPQDKVNEVPSRITIVSERGTRVEQYDCTTRLRGNNSATHPKKPYRVKLSEKHRILTAPANARKWTLINNYGDKTLLRNILAFEISRRMGLGYTPWCQAVDVVVNSDYKGCYQLCDQIEVRKLRVDIEQMDSTCVEGEALTGGYLLEVDAYADSEPRHFTTTLRNVPVTVKYPDSDEILGAQFNYIKKYFQSFESSLFKLTWKDPDAGYRHYLNLPSFLRHFLVGELSGNTDTYWSTYMYKDRHDTQFHVEPVWDFDLAFENDSRTYPICDYSDYVYRRGSHAGRFDEIVDRIVKQDLGAAEDLREMWALARLRNGVDADALRHYVDSVAAELDASQRLNFLRWPIMNETVHQNPVVWGSYQTEVRNVKDYLARRVAWLDSKLRYEETVTGLERSHMARRAEGEVRVWDGRVFVTGYPAGTPYQVYGTDGRLEASGKAGEAGPPLRRGVHMVRIDGQTVKVAAGN